MAPNGWHAVSTSYWYGQGGGGSSPCSRTAYTTRDEAIATGINKLIATFESVRDWKGYAHRRTNPPSRRRMIETVKAHPSQSRQLSLF